jgi:CubicO group peptidase (beta-lactamase class C family)
LAGSAPLSRRLSGMKDALAAHVGPDAVPGLVALVSHGGETHVEVLGSKSYGGPKIGRDSIFRISSMTKPVTAAAAMILVDEGRVDLEEPVDRLIPELSGRRVLRSIDAPLDDTVPAKRPINVRDLLTFTMGMGIVFAPPGAYPIQRAMDDLRLGQGIPTPAVLPPPDEWVRRLGTLPLLHQPGEQWMYNTGADVLGVLAERASGMPFGAFLQDRVFGPLGMRDTGFSVPPSKVDRFVDSYWTNPATGRIELYDRAETGQWSRQPEFPSGAGGLVSTADDFLAFATMLMEGGSHRGRRVLGSESARAMTDDQLTPAQKAASGFVSGFFERFGWGYCMSVVTGGDTLKSPGTYGWDGGMGTSWFNDPKRGLTAILMTQQAQTSPDPPPVYVDFWKTAYSGIG